MAESKRAAALLYSHLLSALSYHSLIQLWNPTTNFPLSLTTRYTPYKIHEFKPVFVECLISSPLSRLEVPETNVKCGTMQKFGNFAGQARHGLDKITPAALMSRGPLMESPISHSIKRQILPGPMSPLPPGDNIVNLSFNVPFSSNLTGPDREEVIHASPEAVRRWTFPKGTEEGTPTHKLPIHANNVEALRRLCRILSETIPARVEASVTSSEPKPIPALQRRPLKGLVTNVCVSGDADMVHKMRARILNETPIALVRFHLE